MLPDVPVITGIIGTSKIVDKPRVTLIPQFSNLSITIDVNVALIIKITTQNNLDLTIDQTVDLI